MIRKSNFRHRGPLESEKCINIVEQTIGTVNEVIDSVQELLDTSKTISTHIIQSVKRRGGKYGMDHAMISLKEEAMNLPKSRVPDNTFRYRGITPSGDINQFIKNTTEDVVTIMSTVNDNTDQINELQSITTIENKFLYDRVVELENELRIKNNQLSGGSTRDAYITIKNAIAISDPLVPVPAIISNEFHQILPTDIIYYPKLFLQDTVMKKNIIPDSLEMNVSMEYMYMEDSTWIYKNSEQKQLIESRMVMTENNMMNAIDGDEVTCWQRKVKIHTVEESHPVTAIEYVIDITIPYEVITNRIINDIAIMTHPITGVDIIDVQMKQGTNWVRIPTFEDHSSYNEEEDCLLKSKPARFIFNDMMPTQVRIVLRQTTYSSTEEYGYNVFYVGAYSIDIGQIRSAGSVGEFSAMLTLDSISNRINSVEAILDNKSVCDTDVIEYELMYKTTVEGNPNVFTILPVGEDMNVLSNILLVKVKTNKRNNIIPALSAIKINYTML